MFALLKIQDNKPTGWFIFATLDSIRQQLYLVNRADLAACVNDELFETKSIQKLPEGYWVVKSLNS